MKKLLIVDDNEKNLYMLQVLLQANGYEVVSAKNGVEALETAHRDPPDMIVADILMPVMDGFSLCREWKKDEVLKHIPFVFYTATYTDPKDEKFALSLGAERFFIKPEKPNVLVEKLQEVIEEQQAGQLSAPQEPQEEETIHLREYNEALIRKLEDKMLQLEERTIKLRENEKLLQNQTYDLGERVKELNCLYSISKLAEMPDLSLEEFLQGTVDLIPQAWQFPEITCSRLDLDGRIVSSSNFKESEWKQASDIMVRGKKSGFLEVCYLEERPERDDGPFLKEERDLINAISEYLGNTIDRKWGEEELKQYEVIVSCSSDMLALLDKEYVYLAANSAYLETFGLTPDELIGHTVVEVFGNEYFDAVIKPNAQRCMSGEQVNFQSWIDFPALEPRFMDVNYYPYSDRENEIKGFVVNGRNITERKKAEEELKKHQEQLEELVEERTNELQSEIGERKEAEQELRKQTEELEFFNKAMVDREMRIIELKEEINGLCETLGKEPEYPPIWRSQDETS